MPQLIYSSLASLDGYIADESGGFDWAVPDEEVLAFITDLERPVGTYLHGRRLYELMTCWETEPTVTQRSPGDRDFAAVWQQAEKVVYSREGRVLPDPGWSSCAVGPIRDDDSYELRYD